MIDRNKEKEEKEKKKEFGCKRSGRKEEK